MRKLLSLLTIVLLILLPVSSFSEASPSFEKAKSICLRHMPDQDGDYILEKNTTIQNVPCSVSIAYSPNKKLIMGAVESNGVGIIVVYSEDQDIYVAVIMQGTDVVDQKTVTLEDASQFMDQILVNFDTTI